MTGMGKRMSLGLMLRLTGRLMTMVALPLGDGEGGCGSPGPCQERAGGGQRDGGPGGGRQPGRQVGPDQTPLVGLLVGSTGRAF
jgi:hypothetical protein